MHLGECYCSGVFPGLWWQNTPRDVFLEGSLCPKIIFTQLQLVSKPALSMNYTFLSLLPIISFLTDVCLWQHALPNKPLTWTISCFKGHHQDSLNLKKFQLPEPWSTKEQKLNQLFNCCCFANKTKSCGCGNTFPAYLTLWISWGLLWCGTADFFILFWVFFWNGELISQGWLSSPWIFLARK